MIKKLLRSYGHFGLLIVLLTSLVYGSGSRIQWEEMPDIRPQVLSLFTEVPDGFVRVVDVVDGDTMIVSFGGKEETVRLLGVDTPETKDPRRGVQCFGRQASEYTKNQVMGKAVKLQDDPSQTDRDAFGRLLRYVYFEDGSTLNERLVYEGYAFAHEKFPTKKLEVLLKMEQDAKKNHRGLWGDCEITIKNNGQQKSTQGVSK